MSESQLPTGFKNTEIQLLQDLITSTRIIAATVGVISTGIALIPLLLASKYKRIFEDMLPPGTELPAMTKIVTTYQTQLMSLLLLLGLNLLCFTLIGKRPLFIVILMSVTVLGQATIFCFAQFALSSPMTKIITSLGMP